MIVGSGDAFSAPADLHSFVEPRPPLAQALELMLTGRLMTASEAKTAGFVNDLVEPAELVDAGLQLATRLR